jgi:hypothetical protein
MTRDSQRSKVYAAERSWEHDLEHGGRDRFEHFATNAECKRYVNNLLKRKRIKKKYMNFFNGYIFHHGINVTHGGRNGWAHSYGGTIRLSPAARYSSVLLHELAHELMPRSVHHDWRYAATMLDLVRQVLGKDEERALKAEYRKHRVKYRKPIKRHITPEQRAILVERIKVARAARKP